MNKKETDRGCKSCVTHDVKLNQITITHPNEKDNQKSFTFDAVFDHTSKQKDVYSRCAYNMVESVAEGYNATIFAYGQTGCGKTHSMMGYEASEDEKGIIPRSFTHIFGIMGKRKFFFAALVNGFRSGYEIYDICVIHRDL
jgi:DNA replication protein DnaC